ncbi:MT-A70 family methyltransferase [Kaistia sp. UC242_56]|uniref:MT-A70 family methyltransferase n=1 Tax=Kaistia sp. UC242_56 TaxID=3374625 RepID=UPI0037BBFD39
MSWIFGDMPMFGYDLIMADPPWRFDTWSDAGKKHKSPEGHYQTMALADIAAMPVGHLAAKDCMLWLWATHPMLPQQIEICAAWGFKFVTSGVWVKRTVHGKLAFGTGYRLRCASEPFLLATNGDPSTCRSVRTVIEGPIREHSRKPDEAYAEAEKLMAGARRADLFSRQTRPGWTSWGHETGKFDVGEAA